MRIPLSYGRERYEVEVADDRLIPGGVLPAALSDPAGSLRTALEQPFEFPALREALTPDDHVVIVLDEDVAHLGELLVPLLEHIQSAGVSAGAMTLLCPPSASQQRWLDDLPESFEDVRLEVFDPTDRKQLAYLATTRKGRRLYLSRTVVDADQVVVLSRRRYDPLLGHAGAEGTLYPAFSDAETRQEMAGRAHSGAPPLDPWPVEQEAREISWLLGAPFFVQVIAAGGDEVAHVVAGTEEASLESRRLLDRCWRLQVSQPADLVVATLSGDPARHGFAELAAALACAAQAVRPQGRIVLLSQAQPQLGSEVDLLRQADEPDDVLQRLRGQHRLELVPVIQWARAVQQAHVSMLCGLPDETVEELFASPLEHPRQVQRLIDASPSCLVIPDAHKALVVVG
jgi:nickel-dependent lactate racemase